MNDTLAYHLYYYDFKGLNCEVVKAYHRPTRSTAIHLESSSAMDSEDRPSIREWDMFLVSFF